MCASVSVSGGVCMSMLSRASISPSWFLGTNRRGFSHRTEPRTFPGTGQSRCHGPGTACPPAVLLPSHPRVSRASSSSAPPPRCVQSLHSRAGYLLLGQVPKASPQLLPSFLQSQPANSPALCSSSLQRLFLCVWEHLCEPHHW